MVGLVRSGKSMPGRQPVRTKNSAALPPADAQTILDTIIANGQARIFVVNVTSGGRFTYAPVTPARRRRPGGPRGSLQGRTPSAIFGTEDGVAITAHYRHCVATASPVVYAQRLPLSPDERRCQ